jgi:hypothetical protein
MVGLGIATGRIVPITLGIVLLGSGYALHLFLDDPAADARAAVFAAGLLATAELASWSIELRREVAAREPGRHLRRLVAEMLLCLGGLMLAGLVLAAADLGPVGGVAIEVAGAVAAVALVSLAVAALRPGG